MKLNIPLELVEVEVREIYLDEDGNAREREKKVLVPTGRLLDPNADNADTSAEKKD